MEGGCGEGEGNEGALRGGGVHEWVVGVEKGG